MYGLFWCHVVTRLVCDGYLIVMLCGAMFMKKFNSNLFRGLVLYQVAAAALA